MNFTYNGGDIIVSLGLGGLTNFTKAIFEVGGGHCFKKKLCCARILSPILQLFNQLCYSL